MPSTSSWKKELASMVRLALPVVLAELGWMLQGVVDVIMVGRMGAVSIGAVALGNALYYSPSLFGIGLLLGLDTVVSQAYGRRDHDACHRWLAQGVYITLSVTPLLMLLVVAVSYNIHRFGVAPELISPTGGYLRVLVWGTLPLLLYAASRRYLQSVGQGRVITLTFVGANLVNWGGNWILINGKLGMPAMGVRGSALSTVISRIMMAITLFWFAWRYEKRRGHPLFSHWAGPHWEQIKNLIRLGLPAASQLLLEVGAFGAATIMAGKISSDALAAHQIALNYAAVAYMVPLGISAAAAIAVGHSIGANDHIRARLSGWLALALGTGFMTLAAATFVLFPRPLIDLYTRGTSAAAITAIGVPLLGLAAAFALFDAVQIVSTGALRGIGLTRIPMLANLFGYWVLGLPLGVFLCFHLHWGVYGVWTGLTVALIFIAATLLLYWHRRSKALVQRFVSTHNL